MTNTRYVFHHIPKTAGTSCRSAFRNWFHVVEDYRKDWSKRETRRLLTKKKKLSRLNSNDLLCGHFDFEGYYLCDRYPEVFRNEDFRVITFLRDPMQLVISDHYFLKANKPDYELDSLWDRAKVYPNYMARVLQCTEENYREVLNRYWFIGIVEQLNVSFRLLARLMGKPEAEVPVINTTEKDQALTSEQVNLFKEMNRLDYQIYEYGVSLFEERLQCLSSRNFT